MHDMSVRSDNLVTTCTVIDPQNSKQLKVSDLLPSTTCCMEHELISAIYSTVKSSNYLIVKQSRAIQFSLINGGNVCVCVCVCAHVFVTVCVRIMD